MSRIRLVVISGGQTGVDRTALDVARALGVETGGVAPSNFWTDAGADPSLASYGLVARGTYRSRTIENVRASDLTVIWGDVSSPGCMLTRYTAMRERVPCLVNPTSAQVVDHIRTHAPTNRPFVLNVAGNRLRTNPTASDRAAVELEAALRAVKEI